MLDGMDFELKTKNILAKSANWLFHNGLVSLMEKNAKIPIGQNLDQMKEVISNSLKNYVITNGVTMQGTVDKLDIDKVYLTPESIRISLNSNGKLNLLIKGLE